MLTSHSSCENKPNAFIPINTQFYKLTLEEDHMWTGKYGGVAEKNLPAVCVDALFKPKLIQFPAWYVARWAPSSGTPSGKGRGYERLHGGGLNESGFQKEAVKRYYHT